MKRLVRMLLVNWYRLDQESIEIKGHTAVIGPNASGKSSLLDALQAVLVGGHKDWWKPNASAGETSTRSLRDYCLGVVRDPDNKDLSSDFQPREQAITYLVLVFEDDHGERISVGLALHARLAESSEHIDGRFIAPGLDMIMADLTDRDIAQGSSPKPWQRLREDLRRRVGPRLILESQAEKFQQQICAELSDGRRHLNRSRFLRAFRNAITFAPIKNVSDFVRGQILEARDIKVKSLQQALENYRLIREKTEQAKDREKQLEVINGHFHRAEQAESLAMSWQWAEQEAEVNALEAELEPLEQDLQQKTALLEDMTIQIEDLDVQWEAADKALQGATQALAANDVAQKKQTLKAQKATQEARLNSVQNSLDHSRISLTTIYKVMDHSMLFVDAKLKVGLDKVLPYLKQDDGLLANNWPMQPADLVENLASVLPNLEAELGQQKTQRDELVQEKARYETELSSLSSRIKHMRLGGSDLSPSTQALIKLLDEHGIKAVPLCDRVDVADEAWRDALESFLGGHREALLVHPDEVRDAVGIYRREGRRLHIVGSKIINTLKTQQWLTRRKTGSLAEVINSEDEHAIAYINRHAGNVLRVASEDELVAEERAITQDGMLVTGGGITRMKHSDAMLGRGARERTLKGLETRFQQESAHYSEIQQQHFQRAAFIDDILSPFVHIVRQPMPLTQWWEQRQDSLQQLDELDRQEQALLSDDGYKQLELKQQQAKRNRDGIGRDKDDLQSKQSSQKAELAAVVIQLKGKQKASQTAIEQRKLLESLAAFNAEQAAQSLEDLENQSLLKGAETDDWYALSEEASSRASRQTSTKNNQRNKGRDALREYLTTAGSQTPPRTQSTDDHLIMAAWVLAQLNELRDSALAKYAKDAAHALKEAEIAFRADFVGKLQENLNLLEQQLDELNRNLKKRPFHGQYYRFVKTPDPELETVRKWVMAWSSDQAGDVGSLFDAADNPAHEHYDGVKMVRDLLLEAGNNDKGAGWHQRLSDYRQYYHFDVRMTDDKEGERNAELLSRRLGKGSGGEHQSPFYVAIGAALSAAYKIERDQAGNYQGGMALAVFDEAFSKLDLQNTASALGFLDELGLQVLLAAPDEKYGQIAEHVDTIINVYREGGNVYVDTDHITAQARQALAADNPISQP